MSDVPADEMLSALERIRDVASRSERAGALEEIRFLASSVLDGRGGSDVYYDSEWLLPGSRPTSLFVNFRSFQNSPPLGSCDDVKMYGVHTNCSGVSIISGDRGSFDLRSVRVAARDEDGRPADLSRSEGHFQLMVARVPAEEWQLSSLIKAFRVERHWHFSPLEMWYVDVSGWRGSPVLLTVEFTGRRTDDRDYLNETRVIQALKKYRVHRDEVEQFLP